MDKHVIDNPESRYGAGKAATNAFRTQRITGTLNILFLLFFVWFVARLAGAERAEMVDVIRNPLVAIALILLIVNVALHMRIGVREVIEDYIHEPRTNRLLLLLNTFWALAVALLVIGSVAKILFWG